MKGPRKHEASQPAIDPNLRPPAEKGEIPCMFGLGSGIHKLLLGRGSPKAILLKFLSIPAPKYDGKCGQKCWKVFTSIPAPKCDGK